MKQLDDKPLNSKCLIALGAALYLMSLIIAMPAGVMEWLLPHFSGERLRLQGARGSFWHGEAADLVLTAIDGSAKPLGAITWRMLWLPLLRGELAISLDLAATSKVSHGIVALIPGGVRIRDMDVTMPASILTEFYPNWKLWQPGGVLEVRSDLVDIKRGVITGAAESKWLNASSSLSHINPFGSYRLSVEGGGLDLNTTSGPLHLTGQGEVMKNGVRLEGLAQAEPASKAGLQDFMRLFGKEDSSGAYRISIAPDR